MTKINPFSSNNYDLGVGDAYGVDKDSATQNILRGQYTHNPKCFACTASAPQYMVVAKKEEDNTAELQNGMYICRHCMTSGVLDPNRYKLKELV